MNNQNNQDDDNSNTFGLGYISDIMNDTDIIFENMYGLSRVASKVFLNITQFPCNVSTSLNNFICENNKDPNYEKICIISNRVSNRICNMNSMGIMNNLNILRRIKNIPVSDSDSNSNLGQAFEQFKKIIDPVKKNVLSLIPQNKSQEDESQEDESQEGETQPSFFSNIFNKGKDMMGNLLSNSKDSEDSENQNSQITDTIKQGFEKGKNMLQNIRGNLHTSLHPHEHTEEHSSSQHSSNPKHMSQHSSKPKHMSHHSSKSSHHSSHHHHGGENKISKYDESLKTVMNFFKNNPHPSFYEKEYNKYVELFNQQLNNIVMKYKNNTKIDIKDYIIMVKMDIKDASRYNIRNIYLIKSNTGYKYLYPSGFYIGKIDISEIFKTEWKKNIVNENTDLTNKKSYVMWLRQIIQLNLSSIKAGSDYLDNTKRINEINITINYDRISFDLFVTHNTNNLVLPGFEYKNMTPPIREFEIEKNRVYEQSQNSFNITNILNLYRKYSNTEKKPYNWWYQYGLSYFKSFNRFGILEEYQDNKLTDIIFEIKPFEQLHLCENKPGNCIVKKDNEIIKTVGYVIVNESDTNEDYTFYDNLGDEILTNATIDDIREKILELNKTIIFKYYWFNWDLDDVDEPQYIELF